MQHLLLAATLVLGGYFHAFLKNGIIFTHFFYIPVVLAAIWWKRKGLVVPIFLGSLLILSSAFFVGSDLVNSLVRAFMFFMVGLTASVLSERIEKEKKGKNEIRNLMEEDHKKSEQQFADIINFFPDATFAIDLEGRMIIWNRAVEELTGVKAEDILGKSNHEYSIPFYGVRRPIMIDPVLKPDEEAEKKIGRAHV